MTARPSHFRSLRDEAGATAVEYGIMVSLIAVVIIVAVIALGQQVSSDFGCTANAYEDAQSYNGGPC